MATTIYTDHVTEDDDHFHHQDQQNDTDNDHDHTLEKKFASLPPSAEITIYVIVLTAIIVTNTLTIVAVATRSKLRTIPNMYVSSLAVADLLIGVSLIGQIFTAVPETAEFLSRSEWACLVRTSIIYILVALSTLSMLLIAFDRFLCIQFPLRYNNIMTKQRAAAIIAASWVVAVAYGTVPMYTSNYDVHIGCEPTHIFPAWYMIGANPLLFFVVSVASFVLYVYIMKAVVRQRRLIQAQEIAAGVANKVEVRQRRKNYGAAKMLFLVFGLFFLCWSPLVIVGVLEYTVHVSHVWLTVCGAIVICHSAMNFAVYAAMNKDFKIAFKVMLCKTNSNLVEPTGTITLDS
ncbi:hypothetical protein BaRGS_00035344 [Batillaria attramentaria]|uniref:G-protein coupled receptors family 1 profile domain-containing protein n=1 Tax=Batillaria attramentaria TaxID=370345 RepID=A0ABD0JGC4_9CAEN